MAVAIVMPKLGMVMSEGMVTRWTHAAGDAVEKGTIIAELETEKVNYDLEATAAGILHIVAGPGETVDVGGVLGYLLAEGEAIPEPPPAPKATPVVPPKPARTQPSRAAAPPPSADSGGSTVPSTPGARRVAKELGIDVSKVPATGPRGRVTDADVRAFAASPPATPPHTAVAPPGMPEPSELVPFARARKAIATHMRSSLAATAQLSFFLEVDVTEAQRRRREASAGRDTTLTFADVILKACAHALARAPALNAMLVGDQIHRFDTINIGFAVALDDGLLVPVVRDVQSKGLFDINAETKHLIEKARTRRLTPDEFAGGTFTVSVLGIVDGFTPILNAGQTAILGVGRSSSKPVVRGGEIVIREISTLSLTVDHQVVDGAVAAAFMRRLQQALERPAGLFD